MVCLGNICRSPLAEGILKSHVDLNHYSVDSAGTSSYHIGQAPDPRAIEVAALKNINISMLRARQFSKKDFKDFDIIYVMDKSNYNDILKMSNSKSDSLKVKLILKETHLDTIEVPDPYYGGIDEFSKVYEMLDKACMSIAKKI
jgi:protein-tyrosine phosphatase